MENSNSRSDFQVATDVVYRTIYLKTIEVSKFLHRLPFGKVKKFIKETPSSSNYQWDAYEHKIVERYGNRQRVTKTTFEDHISLINLTEADIIGLDPRQYETICSLSLSTALASEQLPAQKTLEPSLSLITSTLASTQAPTISSPTAATK